ncbi:MAG: hypothetical protein U0984_17635, partial [Prosthecobacter sp.]|nr:hypothetical protein [Prosthecobacter sp.]
QTCAARWVAGGAVVLFFVALAVLGIIYAKPIQDAYQDWRAEKLVKEARQMAEDGQVVNAIMKAQQAVRISPDNLNAIRLNSEFLTYAKRDEALHFLDRLEQQGVANASDRQLRIRALINVKRSKEASQVLEALLENEEPNDTLMKLAEEIWGESQRNAILLRSMKAYAAKHPENKEHSLRLARIQANSKIDEEIATGMRRARELAEGDDETGLHAVEFLDTFENLPPDEASYLIQRLRNHPKATGWHLVAALKRQLRLDPVRRSLLIQETIDRARGKTREDLLPLVRFLVEQGEYLQVLALVSEDEAKGYQPLLENYLTALTMLQRFGELEKLVNDPKVMSLLNQSVSAFYRAHLAFVTKKPPEEIREALIAARNAADVERRAELLVKIGEYAEARGYSDIAEEAYKSASLIPRTERAGYHGLLRTAEVNGKTEALLKSAREANGRWPDDPTYLERYIYVSLLTGQELETSMQKALSLLEQQPQDQPRRLMAAFAFWRLKDLKGATTYLQKMELNHLTPGLQAVFAAIARDSDTNTAREAAIAVLQKLDSKARMLPEERALFEKAAR